MEGYWSGLDVKYIEPKQQAVVNSEQALRILERIKNGKHSDTIKKWVLFKAKEVEPNKGKQQVSSDESSEETSKEEEKNDNTKETLDKEPESKRKETENEEKNTQTKRQKLDEIQEGDSVRAKNSKNHFGIGQVISAPSPPSSILVDCNGVSYLFFRDQLIKV